MKSSHKDSLRSFLSPISGAKPYPLRLFGLAPEQHGWLKRIPMKPPPEKSVSPAVAPKQKLLDQARDQLRPKHYSLRTEVSYLDWIKRYILFHKKRHPKNMGAEEVTAFLTWLAVERNVAASTQNQALAALLFLYREVFEVALPWLSEMERATRPARLPVVLTREEASSTLDQLSGGISPHGPRLLILKGLRV